MLLQWPQPPDPARLRGVAVSEQPSASSLSQAVTKSHGAPKSARRPAACPGFERGRHAGAGTARFQGPRMKGHATSCACRCPCLWRGNRRYAQQRLIPLNRQVCTDAHGVFGGAHNAIRPPPRPPGPLLPTTEPGLPTSPIAPATPPAARPGSVGIAVPGRTCATALHGAQGPAWETATFARGACGSHAGWLVQLAQGGQSEAHRLRSAEIPVWPDVCRAGRRPDEPTL